MCNKRFLSRSRIFWKQTAVMVWFFCSHTTLFTVVLAGKTSQATGHFGDRSENQIVTIKSYFQLPEKCMVLHTWFIQALDCFFTGALENGYCCQGVQLRNKHKKKLKCKLISLHLMRQLMSRIGTFPQGSKWRTTNPKSTCFNIQSMLLYLSFFHPGQVQNFRYLTSNGYVNSKSNKYWHN